MRKKLPLYKNCVICITGTGDAVIAAEPEEGHDVSLKEIWSGDSKNTILYNIHSQPRSLPQLSIGLYVIDIVPISIENHTMDGIDYDLELEFSNIKAIDTSQFK